MTNAKAQDADVPEWAKTYALVTNIGTFSEGDKGELYTETMSMSFLTGSDVAPLFAEYPAKRGWHIHIFPTRELCEHAVKTTLELCQEQGLTTVEQPVNDNQTEGE